MTTFAGPSQDVFLSKPGDFAGFAVLDTACQRSLCSEKWLTKHRELLAQHKLDVKSAPESEGFQFGTGPIQVSKRHVFFRSVSRRQPRYLCAFRGLGDGVP